MNLYDFLLAGEPSDESVALIDTEDRAWTYGELRNSVEHLCGYIEQSTSPGDRCLIYAENGMWWVRAYLACMRAGRVAVPVPSAASESLIRQILRSCSPRLAFVDAARIGAIAALHRPDLVITAEHSGDDDSIVDMEEALAFLPTQYSCPVKDDDLAAIMYTSGSSSEPRGVMLSHRNIAVNTAAIVQYMGLSAADRILHALPMSYCFGASLLHTHLRVGGCIVLQKHPLFPVELAARLKEMSCTGFAGVPGTYQVLMANSELSAMSFPHLRYFQQAGGRMPLSLLNEVREAFPDKRIYIMYGQTEATARLSYLPPEMLQSKPGSIGKAVPGMTLEVLDANGLPVPAGQVGQIVAQGPSIALGYWQEPEETRKVFRNGKLYTGDLGMTDADGFFYITGRARDFLKLGGVRVSAAQIEEVIGLFPGIRDLAVVSKQDDLLGEIVVLFVVHPRGEEVRQQLAEFCATRLPFAQRPRETYFRAHLPHNSSGKLDRRALQDDLSVQVTVPAYVDTLQAGREGDVVPTA